MDKQIKYYVKKDKRRQGSHLIERLPQGLQNRTVPRPKKISKKSNSTSQAENETVDLSKFTQHMDTPQGHRWAPSMAQVEMDEDTRGTIVKAIK